LRVWHGQGGQAACVGRIDLVGQGALEGVGLGVDDGE